MPFFPVLLREESYAIEPICVAAAAGMRDFDGAASAGNIVPDRLPWPSLAALELVELAGSRLETNSDGAGDDINAGDIFHI